MVSSIDYRGKISKPLHEYVNCVHLQAKLPAVVALF